jgi:3-deoxy-D-manno-octulosonate 8-phosphate phosphatase (KDO 8-P phosphatase)
MGDDLPDLAIMRKAGVAIAVADAHEKIVEAADLITRAKGGKGAVREACEDILKACGKFDEILETFY